MEITQDHRNLIEYIVKNNLRFAGNEDLVEDFCSETFKRSYSIISSVNNIQNLNNYLNKVASSAILEVLKNSGRLRKSNGNYIKIQETPISSINVYDLDEDGDIHFDIPDPSSHVEEEILKQEEIDMIRKIVFSLDEADKSNRYMDIFILRYCKNFKQSEIAKELGISQGEVSKRLITLIRKINSKINSLI